MNRRPSRLTFSLLLLVFMGANDSNASCTLPNQISNGQVADATKVMQNFAAAVDCIDAAVVPTGSPGAGNLPQFSGPTAISPGNLTGDVTTSGTLATTLSNSGVSAGAYTCANVTFDAKGRAIAASNGSCGGSGNAPTLVQYAGVRGTSASQSTFSVTLNSPPTPGNLLLSIISGHSTSENLQNCPSNFYVAFSSQGAVPYQGILVCARISQAGDGVNYTSVTSGTNGGETFAVFEFNGAVGFIANAFGGAPTGTTWPLFGARLNSTSYALGVVESDPINTYSGISGATLLFDGTGSNGGTVNHPSVFFGFQSLSNIVVNYTGSSFGAPIVAIINIVG